MKAIELSAKSWHYRLANFPTPYMTCRPESRQVDICWYLQRIFNNVSITVVLGSLALAILVAVAYTIYDLWRLMVQGEPLSELSQATSCGILVAGLFVAFFMFCDWMARRAREKRERQELGISVTPFLSVVRQRFHERACVLITFKD